jgi:hypothetical protein
MAHGRSDWELLLQIPRAAELFRQSGDAAYRAAPPHRNVSMAVSF